MKTQWSARQGDLLIENVTVIPATAKPVAAKDGRLVLAEGESSGNYHAIADNEATLLDDSGVTYLEVQEAMAMLTHQEHATIELPRGKYRVIRQRE